MDQSQADYIFEEAIKLRIYDICIHTQLDYLKNTSKQLNNQIYLKREDLQPINSFKIRGPAAKFSTTSKDSLKNGVVCASAGNHAQGVALAACKWNVPATIFMAETTPTIKIQAVENLGVKVILKGTTLNDAIFQARKFASDNGALFIEGYNDPMVIAGGATVALEIIKDAKHLPEYIFVPIGGGGLASGMGLVFKKLYPAVKIIGVEPEDSNAMTMSLKAKKVVELDYVNPFAEGVAVTKVGQLNFDCCNEYLDDIVNVTSDEICFAIKLIFEDIRAMAEPSGAVGLAGALKYIKTHRLENKQIATINTGSNVDFSRFRYISERVRIGSGLEMIFAVLLDEYPGTLKDFCQNALMDLKITEFGYRYDSSAKGLVYVSIESKNENEACSICERLDKYNYQYYDLTDDELTKNHLKHLLGGRSAIKERMFQFNWREGQNAIINFLKQMTSNLNLSLFHYRSYGVGHGKILIGIQCEEAQQQHLDNFLNSLNVSYQEVSDQISNKLFLKRQQE